MSKIFFTDYAQDIFDDGTVCVGDVFATSVSFSARNFSASSFWLNLVESHQIFPDCVRRETVCIVENTSFYCVTNRGA